MPMLKEDVYLAIYERSRSDERSPLEHFLDLERNHGMTGVTRSDFEKTFEQAIKYPAQIKLQALTARQDTFKRDLTEAMLAQDPPWDEVVSWNSLIAGVNQTPEAITAAIEGLWVYEHGIARRLKERACVLFPTIFKEDPDGT